MEELDNKYILQLIKQRKEYIKDYQEYIKDYQQSIKDLKKELVLLQLIFDRRIVD